MTEYFDATDLAFSMEVDKVFDGGPEVPESLQQLIALSYSAMMVEYGMSDLEPHILF